MRHGFILDVQGSVRSGSEGYWTSESMASFCVYLVCKEGNKNMFLLSWIARHRKFCKFSLRRAYILYISIAKYVSTTNSRNSASWFLSGYFCC